MDNLIYILPEKISNMIFSVDGNLLNSFNQIRLRIGKPITVFIDGREFMLNEKGLCKIDGYIFTYDDAQRMLRRLNEHSPYIHNESICNGYVTVRGGHRVGIAGEVIYKNGKISYISNQTFFCIRCAHQIKGCFEKIRSQIYQSKITSCLFFSLPGGGKTTMLRDCCRVLSNEGYNVVLVDERNEISGCCSGIPSLDVGMRCDVLSCCPRREGILTAIRGLSPDIIITDEIGDIEDMKAVENAINCGVTVIASMHADSIDGVIARCGNEYLHFDRYVHLVNRSSTSISIFDSQKQLITIGRKKHCCI